MNYLEKIEQIKKQIADYYQTSFDNNIDDYEYNKSLKKQLGDIIVGQKMLIQQLLMQRY